MNQIKRAGLLIVIGVSAIHVTVVAQTTEKVAPGDFNDTKTRLPNENL